MLWIIGAWRDTSGELDVIPNDTDVFPNDLSGLPHDRIEFSIDLISERHPSIEWYLKIERVEGTVGAIIIIIVWFFFPW